MSVKKQKVAKKLSAAAKKTNLTARKTASRTVSSTSNSKVPSKVTVKTPISKSAKSVAKKPVKQVVKPKVVPKKSITVKSITVKSIAVATAATAAPVSKAGKVTKISLAPVVKSVVKSVVKPVVKATEPKPVVVKEEVYKVGDKVVYPAHGVGLIDSIQARAMGNQETKFYMITILETAMKVMVPMKQAVTVGLRRIVDTKTVELVYDILRDKDVTVHQQTWNRRHREYTQKLKTGSVFEIASVIRDLSVLKGDKELSFGERKMLDMAQGLLIKEISIAKSKTEEIIKAELQEICDAA